MRKFFKRKKSAADSKKSTSEPNLSTVSEPNLSTTSEMTQPAVGTSGVTAEKKPAGPTVGATPSAPPEQDEFQDANDNGPTVADITPDSAGSSGGRSPNIEKLRGRENFDSWKIAVRSYLVIRNLWMYIEYSMDVDKYLRGHTLTISELTLAIDPSLYSYIKPSRSAREVWQGICNAFEDKGTIRKVSILNQLVSTKLASFNSMEKYVNEVLLLWRKTKVAGFQIQEDVVASLLLGGLGDEYTSMVLGIENGSQELTVDYIKTVLLQGIPDSFTHKNEKALPIMARSGQGKPKKRKQPRVKRCWKCGDPSHFAISCTKEIKCFGCQESGHTSRECKKLAKSLMVLLTTERPEEMKQNWYVDSGSTSHMTNDEGYLERMKRIPHKEVTIANLESMKITGTGNNNLRVKDGKELHLMNANYIPELMTNLISVSQLTKDGYNVSFVRDRCIICDDRGEVATADLIDGMYRVNINKRVEKALLISDSKIWHRRFGHVGYQALKFLENKGIKISFPETKCETCVKGKQVKKPFKTAKPKMRDVLELIHSDVCGPMPINSRGGHRYFVSFIDDYSRKTFLYMMKEKSEVLKHFQEFVALVQNQVGKTVKSLRSDNGREYINKKFEEFLAKNGIIQQTTVPYNPQQNGVAERFNRTLMEMVRCMLIDANLTKDFWAEAANTATYLLNFIPRNAKSANEKFNNEEVNIGKLHIFGERCYSYIPKEKRDKLDCKSQECIFLGYEPNGYRLLKMEGEKVIISRDVIFPGEEEHQVEQSKEQKALVVNEENEMISIPNSYNEAKKNPRWKYWEEAMKSEFESLLENKTWTIEDVPEDKVPIKCKWVYALKRDANGKILKYKARLVARGFSQIEGIDYQETFAPVVRYTSIRFLLAIAAREDLNITQMDVETAFLNGKLEETIFMEQPIHFQDGTKRSCKLLKSLYGLKQSSRVWNHTLHKVLIQYGLKRSVSDQCIYMKLDKEGSKMYVAIYVDDILIFHNDKESEEKLKKTLSKNFKMKQLGQASSILGMRIIRGDRYISIDQGRYIEDMLKRFRMEDSNPTLTPIEVGLNYSVEQCAATKEEKEEMSKIPYREAIGTLLFLAMTTRPDISFAVNVLSRFCENPGETHWKGIKRIFRYIKGTKDKQLIFRGTEESLTGYSDADWASDVDKRRSTTGYIFTLNGTAISWACKRQATVALSTTEAEYMAAVATIQEGMWLAKLGHELMIKEEKVTIFIDNKGAIQVLEKNNYSSRTKHIAIKEQFLREKIETGKFELIYRETSNMPADIYTYQSCPENITHEAPTSDWN